MIKSITRWLFIILLVGFLFVMKRMNMLYRAQNLFLILLFLASGLTVLGVTFFRDGVMAADEEAEPEAAVVLKKIVGDGQTQESAKSQSGS